MYVQVYDNVWGYVENGNYCPKQASKVSIVGIKPCLWFQVLMRIHFLVFHNC